jgi:TP901 family phage tail tape measure protein
LAYDGTLKFDTSIDSKGFQSGIDGIGSIAEKGLKATGAILAGTATAIGAIGAASVKVGSDFEASMSKVAAISGATGDDLKALTDKAKEMGATTKFSASESADALQYMAMAGWKTEDMLNGLEGIMNLAAASGEDLATTSDIVTDALTAFGLSAEDSTHFADVLAQASSNANTNVGMMGETFKYVAPVAGALGYTAEDTALAIGLMANSGIKASQAGTSLRSIMSRMAKPTKEVQGAMDKLGVSLTDSNGNMKSLNEVMGDLRNGFAGLSEAEAAEMAAALGGQEAMSGLLAIVNASDDDFDKLSDAIYSCDGAAKRMADTMNDNLQGQITILKSGLEGLGISLYENMEAPLKEVVKEAQNMVQQLQDAFNNGGLDSLVTKAGEVMAQIVTEVAQAAPKLIGTAENLVGSFIQWIVDHKSEFASAGATMVAELVRAIMDVAGDMWSAGIYLFTEFLQAMTDHSEEMGQSFGEMISKIGEAVQTNLPLIIQAAKDFVAGFCQGLSEEFPGVSALLDGFFQGFLDTAGDIVQGIVDLIGDIFSVIDSQDPATMEAIGKAIGTIAASIAALKVASEVVGGVKSLLSVLGGFRKTAGSIIGIVPKVVEGFQLLSGGAGTFSEVLALEFPKLAGIITKVTGSLGTLVSTISGIFTKIGAVVGPAISKIAGLISSIGPTIAGIGAVIGGTVMAVTNFFGMLKDGFSWVKEALMVIGVAVAAVGAVILGAPALVAAVVAGIVAAVVTLVVVIKDHWTQIVDFFKGIPDKIGEVVDSVVAWFQELPGRISTWLTNTITAISEWGSELYTNITTFVSEAISAVGDWFSQLPYKIGYALGTAIGTIIQWGINVKDWVTTELPKIIQSVVDWFAQLPGRIWTWLVGVVNNIIAWGQNMYSTITTAATNAVNSVINWFSQLPGRIWTWLVNTVNNVIQWGQNLYSTMTTAATNAINSVTSWFQQLPGKIWTWLVNTVTKVGQWAIDLKNKGVEAAQSLVNAVIDGVSSLPGKMKEVGVNIVNGVWSGICSAKDKFVSDVKSFFSGIVDGVKDALDINSPSRVMKKEVGRWIPPGVGEGIEEEMPELYDQTDEEMAKLAEHMQAAVDVETGKITVRSKAQAEHTADTEMPTGGDTYIDEHIEQENNYHTPVATPSEVSKAQREAARKLLGGVK